MSDPLYHEPDRYEALLPRYEFGGHTDEELVAEEVERIVRARGAAKFDVLEIGPGSGRLTGMLARHATRLACVEASAQMAVRLRERFPAAEVHQMDVRDYTAWRVTSGGGDGYDLVASFWSLNYPLLDCYECNDGRSVTRRDERESDRRSRALIDGLIATLNPGGTLLSLFFDPDSEEQRFVTEVWEDVAPFPGTGRGFTRELLIAGLARWESEGLGHRSSRQEAGEVIFREKRQAESWFMDGHFKGFETLIADPAVQRRVDEFIGGHCVCDGEWRIGAGVHIIRFDKNPVARWDK